GAFESHKMLPRKGFLVKPLYHFDIIRMEPERIERTGVLQTIDGCKAVTPPKRTPPYITRHGKVVGCAVADQEGWPEGRLYAKGRGTRNRARYIVPLRIQSKAGTAVRSARRRDRKSTRLN